MKKMFLFSFVSILLLSCNNFEISNGDILSLPSKSSSYNNSYYTKDFTGLMAAHNCYDEGSPSTDDSYFNEALNLQFYNIELDAMVDGNHSTYNQSGDPSYLQGQVKLYIKHDGSSNPGTRELYKYIEDLYDRYQANNGSIYGNGRNLILTIDFKSANSPDWDKYAESLNALFNNYSDMLSFAQKGDENSFTERAVTVWFSGSDSGKNAYYNLRGEDDGRLYAFKDTVASDFKADANDYFPDHADEYYRFKSLHWSTVESGFPASGKWDDEDMERLVSILSAADSKGYRVRFYTLNGGLGGYSFPEGIGGAKQRWAQFAEANRGLSHTHFVATDYRSEIDSLYEGFKGPVRLHNKAVKNMSNNSQSGISPDIIATNDGRVVEVHKSNADSDLWYSVGTLESDSSIIWNTNYEIGKQGEEPNIALAEVNGTPIILQINKSQSSDYLWYNMGTLNSNNTVNWYKNDKVEIKSGWSWNHKKGDQPSIAASGNKVVAVNKSQSGTGLWYNSGSVSGSSISWKKNSQIMSHSGYSPDIFLEGNQVLVVFQGTNFKLYWCTGILNSDYSISWKSSGQIDGQYGKHPSISLAKDGAVIEIHESFTTEKLWVNRGTLNWPDINWEDNYIWDGGTGTDPSVIYDDQSDTLIEIHKADSNNGLWTNIGLVY